MEEIWKDIEGYEGLYQVSNEGRVKSLARSYTSGVGTKHIAEHFCKYSNNNNYLRVNLYKNGKMKWFSVHRLVAEAFIPNPDNLPQVNHKDEVKTNNHINNLEWCDSKYNNTYGTCKKRMAEKQKNDPNRSKTIYQYTINGELVKIWPSEHECSRYGFHAGAIGACCKGLYGFKTHKGFRWSYVPL